MGERYDCTMIFSLVWTNHSTPRQTDSKSRAHSLYWGVITLIFFHWFGPGLRWGEFLSGYTFHHQFLVCPSHLSEFSFFLGLL
jgi:hypothetical protein